MSGLIATAKPRRIKASHRRRRRAASGQSVQRYYDPGIGRFLSVDPVTVDPNTGANFNAYWYGNNNPYAYVDPEGMCTGSHIENKDGTCAGSGDFLSNGFGPTMSGAQTVVHQASIEAQLGVSGAGGASNLFAVNDGGRQPLYCDSGANCDFMYNQNQFLDGQIGSDEFLDRTQAQGAAGTIGGVVGGAAWASPALTVGLGRALGPSGRILGHPAYGGRTLNFLKSGKYRFGWGRDGGPVLRIGIKNKHIDLMRQQVPRP